MPSLKKINEAVNILEKYDGNNPYFFILKRDVLINGNLKTMTDFQVEYILTNYKFQPKPINKIVKIADWYGEKKKIDWNIEFIPKKIKVISLLGETNAVYHCYIQYRQSVEPIMCFLPKKAVLTNFLVDDYHKIDIDFNRYDKLSRQKDPSRILLPHQKEAVQFLIGRKKCILANGMGTGKTASLSVAAIEGNFDSVLIICPASLKTNWKNELLWYVDNKDVTIVESIIQKNKKELEFFLGYGEGKSGKNREELLEEAKSKGKWENNHFVIVNYDILSEFYEIPKTRSKENIDKAYRNSPLLQYIANRKSLVIIDEAHKLSNNKSDRYKIIKDLVKRGNPDSLYLATGTPVTNNPQNLFCILQLLDDPITNDWDYYMKRYCGAKEIVAPNYRTKRDAISQRFISQRGKKNWASLSEEEKNELHNIIKKQCRMLTIAQESTNLEELKERISHLYLRRLKEDIGKNLPKTIHELHYTLTNKQKEIYNGLWDEYEKVKMEENPNAEINKELLEGAIYRKYLSNEMIPNTIKLVNSMLDKGEKVVIACCYDEELYTLKDYFGDKCVAYNGKMTLKKKDAAIEKFINDDNCMVFIGNIAAAGVGITLTVAHNLVFNNFDFVSGNNEQMEDRICRIGQTRHCHIYYQFFEETQYEHMWNIVLKKAFTIDQIIKKETDK